MARGESEKLPSRIYFLKSFKSYNGPYVKKPTRLQKDNGGDFVEYELDKISGNYIRIE